MGGENLKRQIVELGLSQAEFSRLCKISIPTLNKIWRDEPVKPESVNRVKNTIRRLKEDLATAEAV